MVQMQEGQQREQERCWAAVIGVGSELRGDDAFGIEVVRRLRQRGRLPAGVRLVEGHTGGINLLFEIEDVSLAVIVDAVKMGRKPGEMEVFRAEEADIVVAERVASLHHVGLADVLELGRLLGHEAEIYIIGVEPADCSIGAEMSEAVRGKIEAACEAVEQLVSKAAEGQRQGSEGG